MTDFDDLSDAVNRCKNTEVGKKLYVRTKLTGYVDMGIQLYPSCTQERFARAWNQGLVIFDGRSLEEDDEGRVRIKDEEVGWYGVGDMSYDHEPYDDPDHDMIIPVSEF